MTISERECKPLENAGFVELTSMRKRAIPEPDKGATPLTALQAAFGESVRTARTKAGMSQVELSKRSGIGQKEISEIELGRINLTLRTMSRLAGVLDGDVAKMLNASREDLKTQ